jgi:hypothetical protein
MKSEAPWMLMEKRTTVTKLLKKFLIFYEIQRFITVLTGAGPWFLSWVR